MLMRGPIQRCVGPLDFDPLGGIGVPCLTGQMARADIVAVLALVGVLVVLYATFKWPEPRDRSRSGKP
jgi:hypothetical protein